MNEILNEDEQAAAPSQPEAKVLHQHEINAMVGGAKQKGFEKGYQQAKAELAQLAAQNTPTNSQSTDVSVGNDSNLRQTILEELSKQRSIDQANWLAQQQEQAGMKIIHDLKMKMEAAKPKIEDYDKVVKSDFSNFVKYHEVLEVAHTFDNAGEMLYDLAKNPSKKLFIANLVRAGDKEEAFLEMKKLSDSIKVNEMAANQPKPKMPLSQINPSNIGVGKIDGGTSSADFAGQY